MSAIITFDDGLRTTYKVAYPTMRSFGLVGVCFICGYWIERGNWQKRPTMTLDQIKELESTGWEIGNHSLSHPQTREVSKEEFQMDILGGKQWIKYSVGVDPVSYAYPFCEVAEAKYASRVHEYCRACTNELAPLWDGRQKSSIPAVPRDSKSRTTTNLYWLNRAREENKTVVFIIHDILDMGKSSWDIRTKDFEQLILDIKDSGIMVTTFRDLRKTCVKP